MKRISLYGSAVLAVAAVFAVITLHTTSVVSSPRGEGHGAMTRDWAVTVALAATTVREGSTIAATFTIDNKTGHRVRVTGCPGQEYVIILGYSSVHNSPIVPSDFCAGWMGPGVHVVHALVYTTYDRCGGKGVPRCGTRPKMSDLPPGRYHTQILLPEATSLPTPAPITVVITR